MDKSEKLREHYVWEKLYVAAIFEADDGKLSERIRGARAAIGSRLEVIEPAGGEAEERQAISAALARLNVLGDESNTRDAGGGSKVRCSLCRKPISLLSRDTISDDDGQPVHPQCYLKGLRRGKVDDGYD